MSLTGSLMTYDNNNEMMNNSQEKMVKKASTVVSQGSGQKQPLVAVSTQTGVVSNSSGRTGKKGCCGKIHLNSLWSLWYGILATAGQTYLVVQGVRKFLGYSMLQWLGGVPGEVCAGLWLMAAAAFLLPLLLLAAFLRAGNLPNDGFKLGARLSTCSRTPASSILGAGGRPKNTGVLRSLWQHGGPTAPFLHLVIAFCLLLPRLLMEARLIEAGFLPQDAIWKTDLDFMLVNKDRLIVLSFMTSPNGINSSLPTPLPMVTSPPTNPENDPFTVVPTTPFITTTLPPVTMKTFGRRGMKPRTDQRNQNLKTTSTKAPTTMPTTKATIDYIKPPLSVDVNNENQTNATYFEPKSLPFSMEKTLKDILGAEPWNPSESRNGWGGPISLEFLNYGIALFVYAVRYPAVFWSTNKCFGLIFSFQLLVNAVQSLMSFAGMSVLYKVQVIGAEKALPLLRHRTELNLLGGQSPFLLNPHVTLALFVLSGLLILSSSLVLYLYGYGRFNAFLNTEREKRVILAREIRSASGWGYFTHCAALCVLLSIAVCCAPLLHDYTVVYRGSLDCSVLLCVVSTILHLFLWVLVWLFLTVKQKWVFKLRVTIGRASVRSARSVKLVTDVDLIASHRDDDLTSQPLLVVGNGRTYTVADNSPKKAIMTVIQKAALDKKAKSSGGDLDGDGEEQIYWLRPKTVSLNPSDSNDKLAWFNKKLTNAPTTGKPGQKVTFNDVPCTSHPRNKERGASIRIGEADDGDYATLRELPLREAAMMDPGDDTSEEGKSSSGLTPRCLRRADSGVPIEEQQRSGSGSSGSSPPDPPGSSTSESSSGIHSSSSLPTQRPRANSLDDFVLDHQPKVPEIRMKSFSLQRGVLPPIFTSANNSVDASQPVYGFSGIHYTTMVHPMMNGHMENGVPTTIIENSTENTVIIRRKSMQPKVKTIIPQPVISEEPFGRSTNMKMTTFTNSKESLKNIVASSATLPHYPTQPLDQISPHCSTMPPALEARGVMMPPPMLSGSSCQSFSRPHCTLANHQGGLRLVGAVPAIRRPPARPRAAPAHHSFPVHLIQPTHYAMQNHHMNNMMHDVERDSANFSMASSGDSDNNMYISVNRA